MWQDSTAILQKFVCDEIEGGKERGLLILQPNSLTKMFPMSKGIGSASFFRRREIMARHRDLLPSSKQSQSSCINWPINPFRFCSYEVVDKREWIEDVAGFSNPNLERYLFRSLVSRNAIILASGTCSVVQLACKKLSAWVDWLILR